MIVAQIPKAEEITSFEGRATGGARYWAVGEASVVPLASSWGKVVVGGSLRRCLHLYDDIVDVFLIV
jgi:hypothetical protein